jgi:uncharacterized membrane protein YesL
MLLLIRHRSKFIYIYYFNILILKIFLKKYKKYFKKLNNHSIIITAHNITITADYDLDTSSSLLTK